ncbi:hypothetical protein SYJ56_07835 [Algoriphagus sp. D3-2-R+10]|uniref:hypothetical protein n=1 Tax=Algoriphagus aurantiacus TaxID=3103948 RepID=UPI002B393F2A|nr:hypothetical protein [Algoriphagus sp. D3-2-R+10]MEB2775214.1 hypothetical protein [Algoriphagus sp. D3-2-R+10]
MKKQLIAYLLGLIWLVSLSAIFLVSPQSDLAKIGKERHEIVQEVTSQEILPLISSDTPKTPSFVIDWNLWSKFNSEWISLKYGLKDTSLFYSFFKKSFALFDVKVTFIHFFHPW